MRYAEIISGVVRAFHELDFVPDNTGSILFVSVEGITPEPQQGWLYDGSFSEAPAKLLDSIPLVEFWHRFTQSEKEDLTDSSNKKIKAFLYELRLFDPVQLTDSRLITAINALETAGIIAAGRSAVILAR